MNKSKTLMTTLLALAACSSLIAQPRARQRTTFTTDTLMVHDPVMAFEDGKYYLLSTGMGISWATSADRKTWTVHPTHFMGEVPQWTRDLVPGFREHVWAPDIIRWHGRWWLMYSCSTFGKNTSAIGLLSSKSLARPEWKDEGCVVASNSPKALDATRDDWNAIDPNIVIDRNDQPWLTYGSFWDGIQLVRLDSTMHVMQGFKPTTIARRYGTPMPDIKNPTSDFAGPNAIEAPFIYQRDGWYYLFVSWDYCCRGSQSTYRVVCGRSRNVTGPYLDREGKPMLDGGGTLVIEGDKTLFEAAGHCAVYEIEERGERREEREEATGGKLEERGKATLFICHGYSVPMKGQSILVQRILEWENGWPKEIKDYKEF